MKLSEFERKMRAYWEQRGLPRADISADVYAAEAAGVVWDDEGACFPESLAITPNEAYIGTFPEQDVTTWKFFFLLKHKSVEAHPESLAVAREAVRRWNAWPELRAAVHRWLAGAEPPEQLGRAILSILDGKEGE